MSSAALGVSVHKGRTRARLGRTGPIRATVFTQDAPYKKNDGEKDPLNGWRRDRKHLCVPMAPEHVREIEDRWPTVGAGVENGKHCLEVAIQVYRWNYVAAKLQQIVARVPPAMRNACGQDCSAPSWHNDLFPSDLGAESSRFHNALFPFTKVHVQRRAVRFGRQRAIEE